MKFLLSPVLRFLQAQTRSRSAIVNRYFYNLSLSHKLTLGFGLLVGLSLLVMSRNYLGNMVAADNIKRSQVVRVPAVLTSSQAEADLLHMSAHVRGYLATGKSNFRDAYQRARQDFEAELIELQAILEQDATQDNLELFASMQTKYVEWKRLPDQLFALRDNYLINQPALRLLKDEGEGLINRIESNTQAMMRLQTAQMLDSVFADNLIALTDLQSSFALLISALRGYLVTQNSSLRFEYGAHFIANQKAWEQVQGQSRFMTPEQQQHLSLIAAQRREFMKLPPKMFEIVESDQRRQDLYIFSTQAEPLTNEMLGLLQKIVANQQDALSIELTIAKKGIAIAQFEMILGGLICLIFVLLIAWLLRRKIADPIMRLTEVTAQIAAGDFDAKATVESGDEIGQLACMLNQMTNYLKQSSDELKSHSQMLENQAIALESAMGEAKAANHAKSVFLANMTHELRTPLNSILGFTQLLNRDLHLTSMQKRNLATINRSGEYLLTLINQILELSKVEAGKVELNFSDCNLFQLLESLEAMFRLKAQSKGLRLSVQMAPEVHPFVRIDAGKLKQVCINLLDNAIKFTEQGSVSLIVRRQSTRGGDPDLNKPVSRSLQVLDFAVIDTGFGIGPEELPHLFDPFVQTESSQVSHQGTGLGLAICQNFVKLMGGDLTVQSQLHQGSCFRFSLSLETLEFSADQPMHSGEQVARLASGGKTPEILIVEDKWENRQVLSQLLSAIGYSIRIAVHGRMAVEMWQQHHPDLILMDIQMPVMDGLEATQMIRSNRTGQQPVIIALSAGAFEMQRRAALNAGCDAFISKPFQERNLLGMLAEYLDVDYIMQPIYDDSPDEPAIDGALSSMIDLSAMPASWVQHMNQAAKHLNAEAIGQLIEELPAESQQLKSGLTKLVQDFDFDKIIELTHESI